MEEEEELEEEEEKEEEKEEEELEAAGWCSEAGDESHSLLLLGHREIGLTIFTPFQLFKRNRR